MYPMLLLTECETHGVDAKEMEAIGLKSPNGHIFLFSADPETGGLLVSTPNGAMELKLFGEEKDGTTTGALTASNPIDLPEDVTIN